MEELFQTVTSSERSDFHFRVKILEKILTHHTNVSVFWLPFASPLNSQLLRVSEASDWGMRAAVSCFDDKLKKMQSRTLPESNIIAPERRPGPKRKLIFQPQCFRCFVSFWEVYIFLAGRGSEVFFPGKRNVPLSDFVSGRVSCWVCEFVGRELLLGWFGGKTRLSRDFSTKKFTRT